MSSHHKETNLLILSVMQIFMLSTVKASLSKTTKSQKIDPYYKIDRYNLNKTTLQNKENKTTYKQSINVVNLILIHQEK